MTTIQTQRLSDLSPEAIAAAKQLYAPVPALLVACAVGGVWQRVNKLFSDYPVGTKARESWSGGHWVKTESGWKWYCGSTFPRPGAADEVMLPN